MAQVTRVAVVGGGSWGTALANLLAKKDLPVCMWSFEADVADAINRTHRNSRYLSDVSLDARLRATALLGDAVRGADVVVSVMPAQYARQVLREVASSIAADALVVSATKGLETGSLKTM